MDQRTAVTATYPSDYHCPACGRSKGELAELGEFTTAILVAGVLAACFNCVYGAVVAAGFEDD